MAAEIVPYALRLLVAIYDVEIDEILKVLTVNELMFATSAVKRCVEILEDEIEFAVSAKVLTR